MKTPWYETSPGSTVALLLTKRFVQVDLYTFTPKVGGVFYWAESMFDVAIPGTTWSAKGGMFVQQDSGTAQGHWSCGCDVDTWQVLLAIRSQDPLTGAAWPDKIGNTAILPALRSGVLNGCDVQVDCAVFPLWPTSATYPASLAPTGVLTMFAGEMAEVDIGQTQVAFSINSLMDRFNRQMPRNVYQAGCRHTLYDTGCTLNKDSFKVSGSVEAGSTQSIIKSSIAAPPGSGTLALGRIVCTSGQNAGFGRTVRTATVGSPGTYQLMTPFFWPVQVGDTFDAYAGCNKTFTQCGQFSNTANFGGERFVPAPETAI